MKKRLILKKLIVGSIICSLSISLSGCSLTGLIDKMRDPDKLSAELHKSPRFWNDASAYSESNGLYVLYNEYFKRQPYNNIMSFGDNILLIGQGSYLEDVNDLVNSNSTDFEFSFSVYNPWSNQLISTLSHDDISCDSYQIVGDRLFLYNYEKNTIDVYDEALEFVERYNSTDAGELSDLSFYPGSVANQLLAYDSSNNSIMKIDTSSSFEVEKLDFNMYECALNDVSSDGTSALISGIDRTTLKYTIASYDTSTMKQTGLIHAQNYSATDISDTAFIAQTDVSKNEWTYLNHKDENEITFSMNDIRNTMLLPDGSFILHQEEAYDEEADSHELSYYHIAASGETLSSFTFDCGNPNMAGYKYFSSDFAYLEDCNCIMFLTYTADVNPYVLIWDLNVENADSDINKIKDDGKEKKVKEWGDLSDADKIASELEEKYGVSIYFGEEIPDEIDVFSPSINTNHDEIMTALNNLDRLLNCYPKDFFPQLCYGDIKGLKIYLTGKIDSKSDKMIEDASGFASTIDSYLVITLDITYSWDWDYTVNHEISHMIDKRLEFRSKYAKNSLYSEKTWNKLNPSTFEYMNSYDGYKDNADYFIYPSYFIDSYGTTFATEDRAEMFGRAMDDYLSDIHDDEVFAKDSHIYKKMKFYSACIRDGFDTSGWDYSLPWEMVLK